MNKYIPIKNWKSDDQPREKLRDKGANVLSDAELLAILIGSGSKNESAVNLCKRILNSADDSLNQLAKLSIEELILFKGIGEAKAITITAALELGKRRRLELSKEVSSITSSKDVFNIMQPVIGFLPHEEFWVLYLNNSNKIIKKTQQSKGGITGTLVDVRLVLKTALQVSAVALILCHNHPSGTLTASNADKSITKKIISAGESLDIKVLDHLILTQNGYFSFADEGLI